MHAITLLTPALRKRRYDLIVPIPGVLPDASAIAANQHHARQACYQNHIQTLRQKYLREKIIFFALKFAKTQPPKRAASMPECPQRKKFSQKSPKASRGATVTSYNSGLNVTEQRDGPK